MYDYKHHPDPEAMKLRYVLDEKPTIQEGAVIIDSKLGSWTEIGRNSQILESEIGDYTYDDGHVSITYAIVGRFCSIASYVRINPGNHPFERVTQHHMTYRQKKFKLAQEDDRSFFDWRRAHLCAIGNDVWIGHAAIILPGVKIGTGASIGAGAVVSKDVDPYQVVAGVPARVIKSRFSKPVIDRLLESAWWDWDRKTLETRLDDLNDIDVFLEKYC